MVQGLSQGPCPGSSSSPVVFLLLPLGPVAAAASDLVLWAGLVWDAGPGPVT
jgi:hypothetical protein